MVIDLIAQMHLDRSTRVRKNARGRGTAITEGHPTASSVFASLGLGQTENLIIYVLLNAALDVGPRVNEANDSLAVWSGMNHNSKCPA